ncbi:hypothetical protein CP532_5461 [Ophiocordyceps camponoti-leonardi (nom. inval.)]|nr:hypothetical protein CP532_5461 [Ophiocordyceps camponoti-leonardi (nom. inval.)]
MLLSAFVLSSVLFLSAQAQFQVHGEDFKPDFELEATEGDLAIDCQKRKSVLINGQSPGPQLTMAEGKVTWVRVWNKMEDLNLTMHWHGLSQRAAPFSDGTPLVSQWPIPPGHFFDYEVRPEPGDAGTYFYHSHVGFQLITAHGPLIVEDPDRERAEKEYGKDVVLTLADYYAKDDGTIESGLLADPFRWSGEPNAVLVNGHSGKADFGSSSDASCEPYVIDVVPDQLYRLRTIGATALSMVKLGIEGHDKLSVIEADGGLTEPVDVDHMQVAPGQRFSYRLQTKSAAEIDQMNKTEFWIRYESRERPESIKGYALLRYRMDKCEKPPQPKSKLPEKSPVELPNTTNDYLEYKLQPAQEEKRKEFPRLQDVTRTVTIQINQMLTSGEYVDGKLNGSLVWAQNGNPWKENVQAAVQQMPYLISVYAAAQAEGVDNKTMPSYDRALQNGGFDSETKTFPAKVGEVLDIVWQNNGGLTGNFDIHPMHIHGEHAWDLGSGSGTYDAGENEKRFEDYTPARRDTTLLYRYTNKDKPDTTNGWRAWRVRVTEENVGAWMMHCHIAQHSAMGMNTVWIFGDTPALMSRFPLSPLTEAYLSYGGEAYGSAVKNPTVNHHFGDDKKDEEKKGEEEKDEGEKKDDEEKKDEGEKKDETGEGEATPPPPPPPSPEEQQE